MPLNCAALHGQSLADLLWQAAASGLVKSNSQTVRQRTFALGDSFSAGNRWSSPPLISRGTLLLSPVLSAIGTDTEQSGIEKG